MQQNFRMFSQMNKLSIQSLRGPLRILIFHFLLAHSCRGQSQLIGSSQPIVATVGDDIILPCHLDPAVDAAPMTLEWTRPDLKPNFVHVRRGGQDLVDKHPSYAGRTSLFINELKHGNISLKLFKVKLSDGGTYQCSILKLDKKSSVEFVVASGAVSPPVISLAGVDKTTGGVVLECESKGWYPEPEVLWLDGEGNLLSAGPTETVRGPDDLYTVSSRVTVEKRHSNSFTCRVQQNKTNQSSETKIHIQDDFFMFPSSSNVPIIIGLAVSLAVCIMVILSFVFFVWKKRQNKREKKNGSKENKTQDQFATEGEKETFMRGETTRNKGKVEKKTNHSQQGENKGDIKWLLRQEIQKREKAEEEVKSLEDQLQSKTKQSEVRGAEIQQLQDQNRDLQRLNQELQRLNQELEEKNKQPQLEGNQTDTNTQQQEEEEEQEAEGEEEDQEDTEQSHLEGNQTDTNTQQQEEEEEQQEAEGEEEKLENQEETEQVNELEESKDEVMESSQNEPQGENITSSSSQSSATGQRNTETGRGSVRKKAVIFETKNEEKK
ncbi:butyrophilin subfamily 3 member A2 isoform X1 [Lates calcarifer]|uniref:Butyrophilin subfamily 3 member A2 isoform X1 n=1 Tax=Lates calcarifer TaxID=8187 RepID=A0AAJ8DNT0_LATCA|nr:butyrophilin subfamily 3 member A2 isoform X1 [Lates calcarifer]